jgi:aryl-alcohol dehydrogenase-like predicted oxidoreductase
MRQRRAPGQESERRIMIQPRRLGRTDITVSAIGLGCWQFSQGQGILGGFWPVLPQETVNQIVAVSLAGGVTWFDTAESYGGGRSEAVLAAALTAAGKRNGEVVVATKWRPFFRTAASIRGTIAMRLDCLAPFGIDLHQIHHPYSFASIAAQMHAMADLVEAGRIRSVGVSNFSATAMRAAHGVLASRGIPLASNQVRYSLACRRIEGNGVLDAARELGITIIAFSPLAQGILTGKFHRDPKLIRSRPGPRRWLSAFRHGSLEMSRPVVAAIEEIASVRGATAAQVALNWLLHARGDVVVAIPGATSVKQAEENTGAMSIRLSESEIARLEEVSRPFLGRG